jgi:hypothetical protein
MPMTLKLSDKSGNEYFTYNPTQDQWWITGFDTSHQTVQAANLIAEYTVDFSGKPEMWEGFYNKWSPNNDKNSPWRFDPASQTATLRW